MVETGRVCEYWIQLENKPWDMVPNNINRLSGQTIEEALGLPPQEKKLISPVTGVVKKMTMFHPLPEDALILRRYTPNWAAPDDQRVNPWDLNEPDPTDTGTMGTIPGPTIEANRNDTIVVHFRNMDRRPTTELSERIHSLHPHGLVYDSKYDGAFPLSPPDFGQSVGDEAPHWEAVGVKRFKQGDRVPPGATFTYVWRAIWPTNAGIWLYHDQSVCDVANVRLGAIGLMVIHDPLDPDEVIVEGSDLPGGSMNGDLVILECFPFPCRVPAQPTRPVMCMKYGDLILELDERLHLVKRLCIPCYRTPPEKARYLVLFHELMGAEKGPTGGFLVMNGRMFLGNAPTFLSGTATKSRFGVVGMGDAFQTANLHGQRWVLEGPPGEGLKEIRLIPRVQAIAQFDDTRVLGPANSLQFTLPQSSLLDEQSDRPSDLAVAGLGEWHMHCHVPGQMEAGTMGSFLVIRGGELALGLSNWEPSPVPLPHN